MKGVSKMKITDSEVIRSGESELMDAITADIDWGAIEEIFKEEHKLGIEEDVEYKRGDIIVHDGKVSYKLEFQVNVILSVLLDREGHCISVTSSGDLDHGEDQSQEAQIGSPEEMETTPEDGPELTDVGDQTPSGEGAPPPEDKETESEAMPEDDLSGEDGYEKALGELDPSDGENRDMTIQTPSGESPSGKISRMASQAGEVITEIGE